VVKEKKRYFLNPLPLAQEELKVDKINKELLIQFVLFIKYMIYKNFKKKYYVIIVLKNKIYKLKHKRSGDSCKIELLKAKEISM